MFLVNRRFPFGPNRAKAPCVGSLGANSTGRAFTHKYDTYSPETSNPQHLPWKTVLRIACLSLAWWH